MGLHSRRGFIEALKVQQKANAASRELERVVELMDGLFAMDREAREQKLSLEGRHELRQERAPEILAELHTLLTTMKESDLILPKSFEGKAIAYISGSRPARTPTFGWLTQQEPRFCNHIIECRDADLQCRAAARKWWLVSDRVLRVYREWN